MSDKVKSLVFALVMCILAAGVLSSVASTLKPLQERNEELDQKKNVLKALKIHPADVKDAPAYFAGLASNTIDEEYNKYVKMQIIDKGKQIPISKKDGKIFVQDLPLKKALKQNPTYMPLYVSSFGGKKAVAFPIEGKGLWSTLYGFLALESDYNTVKGLTFYKHGETPGLGAEIEKDWFQNNFVGKKILDANGKLQSIKVAKGKAKAANEVDGMSGATITGNGVTALLLKDLTKYNTYFKGLR